ncbi:MAG: hypothetical protein D6740_07885 [Alphaproteobacteria bacterium]|nr:MAG: hypothetical protein D6740_07885 [Alphaproteobacteria bacterium]
MGTFRALTRFLLGAALCAIAGCARLPALPSPPQAAPASPTALLPVRVTWTYRDASRLAMTLQVHREIPAGYHLAFPGCPVTGVKVQSGGSAVTLYRHPDTGREWLALLERVRWDCRPFGEGDYLVNLTWLLPSAAQTPPPMNDSALVTVSLGALQVDADDGGMPLSLPSQGDLSLPVDFPPPDAALSWTEPVTLRKDGAAVTLRSVFANPSVTWLDACITYPDRHTWQPEAFIREADCTPAAFAQGMPLVPADSWGTSAWAASPTRCFTFALPFAFPERAGAQVSVGVAHFRVVPDAGTLRVEECEAARRKVEAEYPGLEIRCRAYDIQGEAQHWFEVTALPPDLSPAEARRRMEDALQAEIIGPWGETISVRSTPPSR